jgi:hypothetical protein
MRRNAARRLERAKYNAGNPDDSAGGEIWVLIGRSVECEYRTRNNEYRISKGNAEMRRNVARRLERAKYNAGNPDDGAGGEIWVLIGRSVECE